MVFRDIATECWKRGRYEAQSRLATNNEDTIPASAAPDVSLRAHSECSWYDDWIFIRNRHASIVV